MNNIYFEKIVSHFGVTNTLQGVFDKCGVSPYSSTANRRFLLAWNALVANGRIQQIGKIDGKTWLYRLNK